VTDLDAGLLFPAAAVGLIGLWWVLAPQSVVRLYSWVGNKGGVSLGAGVIRGFGVVLLVMIATAVGTLALAR